MLKKLFYASASILMLALAYHLGATTATAQSPTGEVAVLTATLMANDPLPLPIYKDGTMALASDCHWIVSPALLDDTRFGATVFRCETFAGVLYSLAPDDGNNRSRANCMAVAVRGSGAPTPSAQPTFGQLKAQYRK